MSLKMELPKMKSLGVMPHFMLWNLGLAKAWTYYGAEECASLEKYAAGKKCLVEIGCWQGVNTRRLRSVMGEDAVLFAVDPYPAGRLGFSAPEMIAHKEVDQVRRGKMEWIKLTDLEAALHWKENNLEPADFIFSDSLNTYEGLQASFNAWSPLLKEGGIYIIANSRSTPQRNMDDAGSVLFTKEVIAHDARFKVLDPAGSFTILKRL